MDGWLQELGARPLLLFKTTWKKGNPSRKRVVNNGSDSASRGPDLVIAALALQTRCTALLLQYQQCIWAWLSALKIV